MDLKDLCVIRILSLKSSVDKTQLEKLCELSLVFNMLQLIPNKQRRREVEKELRNVVKYGRA